MVTIEDAKKAVRKIPATLHIKGTAVSRYVYSGKNEAIDATFMRNHNWGAVCSGATRLAEDLYKFIGCSSEVAAFLAPTLSEYILAHLADNFEVKIKIKKFMACVFTAKTPSSELYGKFVTVISEKNPKYVEVSKSSLRPDVDTSTKLIPGSSEDEPEFVQTEFGRQRSNIPEKMTKELNKFRGIDEDKKD